MTPSTPRALSAESGFSLIEVMVTTGILMVVSAVVMSGVLSMAQLNSTVTNRAQMFAGVRNATALLQQEVGQAGRVTLPGAATLSAAVAPGANTVNVSFSSNMFVGENVTIGTGDAAETVTVTAVGGGSITATFTSAHANNEPVSVRGAFSAGVIPPTVANGSTAWTLKMPARCSG